MTLTPFLLKTCELPELYTRRDISIPLLSILIGDVYTSEFVLHIMVLSLFASLIAPFAGFFASGIKRGLKIKVF